MDENRPHSDEDLRNPHVRYEPGDVDAHSLARFGIGMAFLIVVFMFGLWGLFSYFARQAAEVEPARRQSANLATQPPEPRLQQDPPADLSKMRNEENQVMNQYAWVDPDKGVVRIPVARAMELIVQKGLPSRVQEKAR